MNHAPITFSSSNPTAANRAPLITFRHGVWVLGSRMNKYRNSSTSVKMATTSASTLTRNPAAVEPSSPRMLSTLSVTAVAALDTASETARVSPSPARMRMSASFFLMKLPALTFWCQTERIASRSASTAPSPASSSPTRPRMPAPALALAIWSMSMPFEPPIAGGALIPGVGPDQVIEERTLRARCLDGYGGLVLQARDIRHGLVITPWPGHSHAIDQ